MKFEFLNYADKTILLKTIFKLTSFDPIDCSKQTFDFDFNFDLQDVAN